jgi:hypothetical protein
VPLDSCCARWLQERSYRIGPPPPACPKTLRGHLYWSHGWSAQPRSHSPRLAACWLRAAQPGVIAVTTGPVSGNCDRSYKGAWRLNFTESRTVASSTAACLDKCDRCANCNYISVSAWERDCSWFMQRDTTTPSALATGFLSGPSRRLNASLAASVLARQGHHFVKGMVENPAVGHHKITQCQGYLVMASCRCRRVRVAASVWPRVALRYLVGHHFPRRLRRVYLHPPKLAPS